MSCKFEKKVSGRIVSPIYVYIVSLKDKYYITFVFGISIWHLRFSNNLVFVICFVVSSLLQKGSLIDFPLESLNFLSQIEEKFGNLSWVNDKGEGIVRRESRDIYTSEQRSTELWQSIQLSIDWAKWINHLEFLPWINHIAIIVFLHSSKRYWMLIYDKMTT